MTKQSLFNPLLFAAALAIGGAACGADATGDASGALLTIQGDPNLYLEPGYQRNLQVRYTDTAGNPLVGEISFDIEGDPRGSTIDKAIGATNATGDADTTLFAGELESVFRVRATAPDAIPVEWVVSVTESAVNGDLDVRGRYELDSDFDVVSGMPGTVGDIANIIVDISDGPNDPATFVLDQIVGSNGGAVASAINNYARPTLDILLNDLIEDNAPDVVLDMLALANDFGEVTKQFGTVSVMDISGDSIEDNSMSAVHTVNGYRFDLNGQQHTFSLQEMGSEPKVIPGISVVYDRDSAIADFSQHTVPVEYGAFLALALEEVIIPSIDPSADSLLELLENNIDCEAIGIKLNDEIGILGASVYEGACTVALEGAASIVMEQLQDLDDAAQVNMIIDGKTTMKDPSGDRVADIMSKGQWNGAIEYLGSVGELEDDSSPFTGERLTTEQ